MDVKTQDKAPLVEPRRSCKGCAHVSVCQIFRVEAEYLNKEFIEKQLKAPFAADQLAAICGYFLPLSSVRLTTTQEPEEK